jgi:hypothetical protein
LNVYATAHGYQLHFVEPQRVMRTMGSVRPDRTYADVIASKSRVMHCKVPPF